MAEVMQWAGILATVGIIAIFVYVWMLHNLDNNRELPFTVGMAALAKAVYQCQTRRVR